MIPLTLVIRGLACVLRGEADRKTHFDRRTSEDVRRTRTHHAAQLRRQADQIESAGRSWDRGITVDAEVYGLLIALAQGHAEARQALRECLADLGEQERLTRLVAVPAADMAGTFIAVCGPLEGGK